MSDLQILHDDEQLAAAHYRHVFLTMYRAAITLEILLLAESYHDRVRDLYDTTSVVSCTEHGLSLPSPEVRAHSAQLIRKNGARIHSSVVLVPGEGFWPSAARGVLTGIFALARQPFPMRVFGDATSAARFTVNNSPPGSVLTVYLTSALSRFFYREEPLTLAR